MPVTVICEIDPRTGEVTYEVEGAVGTKCTDITNALTAGKKVLNQELKNSYYETQDSPDFISNLG